MNATVDAARARRWLVIAIVATAVTKLVLAWRLPVTFDEAYFTLWARSFELGYYDHPPMIGWVLWALRPLGSSAVALRLPAVLLPLGVNLVIYLALRRADPVRAALAALLFTLAPLSVFNVLVTTDTPLFLFSIASTALLARAVSTNRLRDYAASGVLLGLALLSKYFAALLGAAYLVYFAAYGRDRQRLRGLVVLVLSVLPFAALHLWWNYQHCWPNLLFNFINRNRQDAFSLANVGLFVLTQLLLLTPVLAWALWRHRTELRAALAQPAARAFALAVAVPVALLALLSLRKLVGLHWALSFYPMAFVLLGLAVPVPTLRRAVGWMMGLSGVPLLFAAVVLAMPMERVLDSSWVRQHPKHREFVMQAFPEEVLSRVGDRAGFVPMTTNYGESAALSFASGDYFAVFGTGTHYGRHDDLVTDFSALEGADLLLVSGYDPERLDLDRYFERVEAAEFTVGSAIFHVRRCYRFRYGPYQQRILAPAHARYWTLPAWLPRAPGSCEPPSPLP